MVHIHTPNTYIPYTHNNNNKKLVDLGIFQIRNEKLRVQTQFIKISFFPTLFIYLFVYGFVFLLLLLLLQLPLSDIPN